MGICTRIKQLLKGATKPEDPLRKEPPPLSFPKITKPVTIDADAWQELQVACAPLPLFFSIRMGEQPLPGSLLDRLFPHQAPPKPCTSFVA